MHFVGVVLLMLAPGNNDKIGILCIECLGWMARSSRVRCDEVLGVKSMIWQPGRVAMSAMWSCGKEQNAFFCVVI